MKRFLTSIAECQALIIMGLIEEDRGCIYNTAVVICKGEITGKYRKQHLNESGFAAGWELLS